MNPGNARIYTPVMRTPSLFHQNNSVPGTNYYSLQQNRSLYPPASYNPRFYEHAHYPTAVTAPSLYQSYPSYPYHPAVLGCMPPLPLSYAPAFISNPEYPRSISPNGLTLILIAILFLVALDLIIVRPQKGY